MSLASEFKEFAMKGSVIDLAVGVVIGAAFGKIVASLVGDVIMPGLSPMFVSSWLWHFTRWGGLFCCSYLVVDQVAGGTVEMTGLLDGR